MVGFPTLTSARERGWRPGPVRLVALCLVAVFFLACGVSAEEPSQAQASELDTARAATARICSWNIRRLGHLFDHRAKDLEATASIITDNCDVVVVQEVMQTRGVAVGYDALLAKLGDTWGGIVTDKPRPNTTAANAERYAWYYRKTAAKPCANWQAPQYLPDDEDIFLREPAWTCLKVGVHARDLILVSYHAIFGSISERKREVGWIDDDLDEDGRPNDVVRAIRKSRPGADVLFVGDFNLKKNEIAAVLPEFKDLTAGTGSTINDGDEITDNLYDHLLLAPDEPLARELAPAEVLDVRSAAKSDTYFRSISDHLPIRFVLGRERRQEAPDAGPVDPGAGDGGTSTVDAAPQP
jgi:endonuclease/exonuclease/phosphatase family metal-dependent hydrolase